MKNIILPNTYVTDKIEPLIFLAGPIKGAPDWQSQAIEIISQYSKSWNIIYIASPRPAVKKYLENQILRGVNMEDQKQREWEWYHQNIAAKNGVIMFWFPGKDHEVPGKSYGLITSNEFGYWTARHQMDNSIKLAIGSDGRFNQWNVFNFDIKFNVPDITVRDSLEETCIHAINLLKKK
ncbi:MAG TPA: nucleoside 2-deoxyribosyltransferase domain-containing protein [Alphaproteobacteria bacterium]|nr:nucleoside 2-deoxyribosyltransferase domain-containing protein [Alphaproteobacteria bacterium]